MLSGENIAVQNRQLSRDATHNAETLLHHRRVKVNKERTKSIREDDQEESRLEREAEREEAAKRVLTRHLIIAFKHKQLVRSRPVFKEVKIEARNFAILLLQQLETRIDAVKREFTSRAKWKLSEFTEMLTRHTHEAIAEEATIREQRETEEYFRQVMRQMRRLRREQRHEQLQQQLLQLSTSSVVASHASASPPMTASSDGLDLADSSRLLESGRFFHGTPWYLQSTENLQAGLRELFAVVDHHHTGTITWERFIAFCIDATMKGRVGIDYDEAIAHYQPGYLEETRELKGIRKLRWCPDIARVLACGHNYALKVIDPTTWLPQRATFAASGQLLDAEYVPDTDQIVTTSSDLTVRFFDYQRPKRSCVAETDYSQLCVKWSKRWGRLYTGGRVGELMCWNVHNRDEHALWYDPVVMHTTRPHSAPVTDMLFLPVDGSLVTCSLDATICVQEPKHGQLVQRFLGHRAGILCIAYATDYNFLISAGIEVDPQLWITAVSATKPFTLRDGDHPHSSPVCGVRWIPGSPQVVTLDAKGMMKIWDVRTFECVQTIVCSKGNDTGKSNWFSLEYLPSDHQIACTASRRAYVYEYNFSSAFGNATAHDDPIVAVLYNAHNKTFLTAAGRNVRVWNAATGEISSLYNNAMPDEITAVCLDADGRKYFLGTHLGHITAFNYSNGCVVRFKPLLVSICRPVLSPM